MKRRLPTITEAVWAVGPYPLLGYGSRDKDRTRNAVYYLDKILKGAKPGDLPIQQPAKFELVVNLKTAKYDWSGGALSILARADEVIE